MSNMKFKQAITSTVDFAALFGNGKTKSKNQYNKII